MVASSNGKTRMFSYWKVWLKQKNWKASGQLEQIFYLFIYLFIYVDYGCIKTKIQIDAVCPESI